MCLIVFPAARRAVSLPTRATPDLHHYRTPTTKPRYETHYYFYLWLPIWEKIVFTFVIETVA